MRNDLPQGKGMYIWVVRETENGDPVRIAEEAKRAGLGHVLWHVVDGWANDAQVLGGKRMDPYVREMERVGIENWGWGAIYPTNYMTSVAVISEAVARLNLRGFVIDAEARMKGQHTAAARFMDSLRRGLPNVALGLSSYRFPSVHPTLPWKEFRAQCDFDMPQVYFEKAHNPRTQLRDSYAEFAKFDRKLPYVPTGPIYQHDGWQPTVADIQAFLEEAKAMKLAGVNFWVWYQARRDLPAVYEAMAGYPFAPTAPTVPADPARVSIPIWAQHLDDWARERGYTGPLPGA